MAKQFNFEKYLHRGFIKETMKNRGIRTINIHNYLKWKGYSEPEFQVKTLKLDLQNGYLYLMDDANKIIENQQLYDETYNLVVDLFNNENLIPYKKKRNIIVKLSR